MNKQTLKPIAEIKGNVSTSAIKATMNKKRRNIQKDPLYYYRELAGISDSCRVISDSSYMIGTLKYRWLALKYTNKEIVLKKKALAVRKKMKLSDRNIWRFHFLFVYLHRETKR